MAGGDQWLSGKRVMVTGCCGTIGSQLVRQLLEEYNAGDVVAIDNNETELFFQQQRFARFAGARFLLGDIRDRDKLVACMRGVDLVFHTAAYKHVVLCERSPFEAVQTNILGVKNIIQAAFESGVKRVIFTSSDKAVNPSSVMGTSKLMGERLITAANSGDSKNRPVFAATRFGNVLGSRGSVVPIFCEQIRRGGPVTLTHKDMSRFVMSITEAVRLVVDSMEIARGGEVFVTKMPSLNIEDLARELIEIMAPKYGFDPGDIAIQDIGTKPGEKMYEELINIEETRRCIELPAYFAILPAFRDIYGGIQYDYPNIVSDRVDRPYISSEEPKMTRKEIREFLLSNGLLEDPR